MNTIRNIIFSNISTWNKLEKVMLDNDIHLSRGNIIPKHDKDDEYIYPVYSSSIHSNGLMGYNNSYMFDKELITWSIDGGGNFFYRPKHKFNVTNVSGIIELNTKKYNYKYVCEALIYQHEKMHFDYQSKAHPSVIKDLYKIPVESLSNQMKYQCVFEKLDEKIKIENKILNEIINFKKYMLNNLFI